jgi:hypothetical protein
VTSASGEQSIVTPVQEAQAAYKQAKKLKRGAETLRTLLQQAQSQVRTNSLSSAYYLKLMIPIPSAAILLLL